MVNAMHRCGWALPLMGQGMLFVAAAAARPDLFSNGAFVTNPGAGAAGAGVSLLQQSLSCETYGYLCQTIPTSSRLADDFTITAPGGWVISAVVLYGFQTGAGTGQTTFTSANLRIWSGRPGDPGSTVLFGDTTTNRFVGASWTGSYRAPESDLQNATRPIFAVEVAVSPALQLPAGTYWLDWQASGTISSGPWAVPVTILGQTGALGANARAKTGAGAWVPVHDTGNPNDPQDLAFIIRGTGGGGTPPCYPNCDASTTSPCLNVLDFGCFLNKFAAGDSYANCDSSTVAPVLNVQDFGCFLNKFAANCSNC